VSRATPAVAANAAPPVRAGVAGRRLPTLLLIELFVAVVLLAVPLVLGERTELVTLMTNVLILSMLAISFDLCWGYSGIMSFGQALFFGVAGYVVALVGRDLDFSQIWGSLPLAALAGLGLALLFALFLLLGRRKPTQIFVALGTLTGSYAAERLVSGWRYVGAGNGLSSIKLLQAGSYEFVEGVPFYLLALGLLVAVYSAPGFWCARSLGWCWRVSGRTKTASPSSATASRSSRRRCSPWRARSPAFRAHSTPITRASSGRATWGRRCPPWP
jgi:branched-chain amino acid transport system permease protein